MKKLAKKLKKEEEKIVEYESQPLIICGHEEVPAPEGYKGDEKWFKCGVHGIHKLSDCSKLCIK